MSRHLVILTGLMVALSVNFPVIAQKIEKCTVKHLPGGKYRVFSEFHVIGKTDELLLDVILKPKDFTKEFMRDFADRVKKTYCNENVISVQIFDDKKAAIGADYDFVVSHGEIDRRRGTYYLNRTNGKDAVEFSRKRGSPVNEVRIDFSASNVKKIGAQFVSIEPFRGR